MGETMTVQDETWVWKLGNGSLASTSAYLSPSRRLCRATFLCLLTSWRAVRVVDAVRWINDFQSGTIQYNYTRFRTPLTHPRLDFPANATAALANYSIFTVGDLATASKDLVRCVPCVAVCRRALLTMWW
jgi:hypothetical protein